MPQHILRLVSILVTALILAVVAAHYFTDSSYYRFGNYRADAVPELASPAPQFQGSASCQACHAPISLAWNEGIHAVVQCEVCHGKALGHPDERKLIVPTDTVQLCSLCHQAMPARPETQPQIVIDQHPYPHEQPLACTNCHNAHAPRIGGSLQPKAASATASERGAASAAPPEQGIAAVKTARPVPPLIAQCASCHGAAGEGIGIFPALAGRESGYLATQLQRYRSGELPDPLMSGIVAAMDDDQLVELAEYYADLPKPGQGKK